MAHQFALRFLFSNLAESHSNHHLQVLPSSGIRIESVHVYSTMGRPWTEDEDAVLKNLYRRHGKQWSRIASQMENRTASQVAARWEKCLNPALVKGQFTADEDRIITEYVQTNGASCWPCLCAKLGNRRSPKQCRERWFNRLDPSVQQSPWTANEDRIVFDSYKRLGPKWSLMASHLPGRPDNAIKNRWNSSIRKRIQTDPNGLCTLLPGPTPRKGRAQPAKPPPLVDAPITFGVAMNLPPLRTSGQPLQWLTYPVQGYLAPLITAREEEGTKENLQQESAQFTGFTSPHILSPGLFSLFSLSGTCSPFSASGQNVFASNE
jgi:hypothetical protein